MTAQKTHVGFNKKGELTSGTCRADKGRCPYGNHFADPSEAHNYLEEVSNAFQSLEPTLREGYQIHVQAMGESKIPFDEAVEMGFPEDIAHLLAGEPTDPKYARENVGKDVVAEEPTVEAESDGLKELREALSANLGDLEDDDDYEDYEPPASMSEAVGEFMAKREASLRDSLTGETHPLVQRSKPEDIDLETEEGFAKFQEVLSTYKMSARSDFEELPPALDRQGYSYSYGDRGGDYYKALEGEYHNFGVALTAMRTGQTDQLNVEEL